MFRIRKRRCLSTMRPRTANTRSSHGRRRSLHTISQPPQKLDLDLTSIGLEQELRSLVFAITDTFYAEIALRKYNEEEGLEDDEEEIKRLNNRLKKLKNENRVL